MKKMIFISLLMSFVFFNSNLMTMNNPCPCNNYQIGSSSFSEEQVQKHKDAKAKEVLEREKIEKRKHFFGKIASSMIAAASVCIGLGSIGLSNIAYRKAAGIQSHDKRDLCRLAIGICSVCIPVLGMIGLNSAEQSLGRYGYDSYTFGYATTTSLKAVSCIAVFINCFKSIFKTTFINN